MRLNDRLRELLRLEKYNDGLTTKNLMVLTGAKKKDLDRAIAKMPDTYIDRWILEMQNTDNTYAPVWCIVIPPPNCPKPYKKRIPR